MLLDEDSLEVQEYKVTKMKIVVLINSKEPDGVAHNLNCLPSIIEFSV